MSRAATAPTPDPAVNEAAVAWLSRRETGLDAAGEAEFRAWLAADPRHADALAALEPGWRQLNRARAAGRGADLRAGVERVVTRRRRRRFAAASGLLAAACLLGFFFLRPEPAVTPTTEPTLAVRPDRRTLADGSVVELNRDAQITVDFSSGLRAVRLVRGQALFQVAKDSARPFVVTAGRLTVRAVGTEFAVALDPAAVDVLVTEGRVAVAPGQPAGPAAAATINPEAVLAGAGDRMLVTGAAAGPLPAPQRVTAGEIAALLSWRTQRIDFDGTPLRDAVRLFNARNRTRFAVANDATGELRLTGVFWTSDPDAFARALETSFGLRATPQPDGRILLEK